MTLIIILIICVLETLGMEVVMTIVIIKMIEKIKWMELEWHGWKRWALDRPPPWARDCDCCYPTCPEPLICLRQSDNLYLACRGKSVGQVLDELWTQRPETVVGVCVAVVGLWLTWVALQVNKVWWWWREDGSEAKEEEEDEEDDDEEEEGEEEKTN